MIFNSAQTPVKYFSNMRPYNKIGVKRVGVDEPVEVGVVDNSIGGYVIAEIKDQ